MPSRSAAQIQHAATLKTGECQNGVHLILSALQLLRWEDEGKQDPPETTVLKPLRHNHLIGCSYAGTRRETYAVR